MPAVLRVLRRLAIWAGLVLAVVYVALIAFLYANQRDMLFVRGRIPHPIEPPYQATTIAEKDGTRLVIREAVQTRAGAPVIVIFYGNAGTVSDFAGVGSVFHDEGFSVVLASYRGYPGNSGSPSEDGLMADARAILHALPPGHGPVVLWGQSLGSGVAARMASEGRASALILQSPYTAVVEVAARRFPVFPVRWLMKDHFDTLSVAARIKAPVLIMSGDADHVVPHDMAETLAARIGRQATLVTFPHGTHELYAEDVLRVVDGWLKATLKRR